MKTKLCRTCNTTKLVSEFNKNKTKKDGFQTKCHSCMKQYKKRHYSENRRVLIAKSYNRKVKIREWFNSYKENLFCGMCGEKHIATLDFHHRDKTKKDLGVSVMVSHGYGKNNLLKELEKCDVLCANCHRKLHYDEKNADVV